jgi:hypothetical protein
MHRESTLAAPTRKIPVHKFGLLDIMADLSVFLLMGHPASLAL